MPAERILDGDTLKVGKDKLNKAIDQANKSEVESAGALEKSESAVITANTAKSSADSTRTELDAVVNRETDTDAMSRQAAVDAAGVDKINLKTRIDDDYNEVTGSLADFLQYLKDQSVNVRTPPYNAKGDGTDETALIQQILDNHDIVFFPNAPVNYIAENLQLRSNHILIGAGKTAKGLKGKGTAPVFKTGVYPAGNGLQNRDISIYRLSVYNTNFPCIEQLTAVNFTYVDSHFQTTVANAIKARYSYRGYITNCHIITGGVGSNIEDTFALTLFDNCNGVRVDGCTISGGSLGSGIDAGMCQGLKLNNNIFEVCGGYGIRLGSNKTEGISGNCNGFEINNNYMEQVKRPISIGFRFLCLGGTISANYIGNTAMSSAGDFGIQLGRVVGAAVKNNSYSGKGTEPFINFSYLASGGASASYMQDSEITDNYTSNIGSDYAFDSTFTNTALAGYLFGNNRIKFMGKTPNGVSRQYTTEKIVANVNVPSTVMIPLTLEGGVIDKIEIFDKTGTVDCSISIGSVVSFNETVNALNLSTLTYERGYAEIPFTNKLIRRSSPITIYSVAGTGNGTFRLKITYRN